MTDMNDQDNDVDPKVEETAREMGWVPLEKFKGDESKWVDAQTYVERGEHVLPILRADRNRLRNELLTRDEEIGTLKQQLDATQKIVQGLEKSFSESLQRQLAAQRAELKAQLKEAVEDRDVDTELALRDQLDELTAAEKAAKEKAEKKPETPEQPEDDHLSPDFKSWKKENSWFGGDSKEDKKRTKAILRIAEDLRDEGDDSTGREFMDKCLEILEEQEGGSKHSKVDGGSTRSGNGSSGGAGGGYASLPAEAKQACMNDAENFVGEGKMFKTDKEWKDYYAKIYYGN